VRGADDEQRLSFGPVIFLLEVANLFESRHIPMQAVGTERHARAYLTHDTWRKRSATFMAKIRVQCIFHTIVPIIIFTIRMMIWLSALLTRG